MSVAPGNKWRQSRLRDIPAAHLILNSRPVQALLESHQRELVTQSVSDTLQALRSRILAAPSESTLAAVDLDPDALGARVQEVLEEGLRPSLRRVVNATGVVLHTNLGRAPLAEQAIAQIQAVASGYNNLELNLATGERGSRYSHVEALLCRLTGAEAAMVVNNNAGAVLLAVSALCKGREVIVSRGELVEIGGAFRVPDVMIQGGARLVEVGTTNKTHVRDYESAVSPETGAILKVHSSNFKIVGFTVAPSIAQLADVAQRHAVPLLVDWGSGVMVDLERFGLEHESTMSELIAQGAALVTFSGDKLLGGPQGGFIVGQRALVEACRRHPLTRALRIDKLTLAGIEATLKLYLEPEKAIQSIPTLRALKASRDDLRPLALRLAAELQSAIPELTTDVRDDYSQAGGGSLPGVNIPTVVVGVTTPRPVHEVEEALRRHDPPVMVRVHRDQLVIDPRALMPEDSRVIVSALRASMVGSRARKGNSTHEQHSAD